MGNDIRQLTSFSKTGKTDLSDQAIYEIILRATPRKDAMLANKHGKSQSYIRSLRNGTNLKMHPAACKARKAKRRVEKQIEQLFLDELEKIE